MSTLTARTPIIGVMGPGKNATIEEIERALELGKLIAEKGWIALTGGVNQGVMDAVLRGAKEFDPKCVTIGVLPHRGEPDRTSEYITVPIPTGLGEGRNNLNILMSDFVILNCNKLTDSPGTMVEAVLAIKHKKPLVCLHGFEDNNYFRTSYLKFLHEFKGEYKYDMQGVTNLPSEAIEYISEWLLLR
jgi:uncharacterized protein (TIGR00725 family)